MEVVVILCSWFEKTLSPFWYLLLLAQKRMFITPDDEICSEASN